MKTMLKVLSLAAILAASAPLAMADPFISGSFAITGGTVSFNTNSVWFVTAPNTIVGDGFPPPGNGAIFTSPYTSSASAFNFVSDGSEIGNTIFTASNNGVTLTLTLGSLIPALTGEVTSGSGPTAITTLNIGGLGTLTETGFAATPGAFSLTSTGIGGTTNLNFVPSLGALAPPAVPEPSSLMLLGTGLLTAVGVARRKLRS